MSASTTLRHTAKAAAWRAIAPAGRRIITALTPPAPTFSYEAASLATDEILGRRIFFQRVFRALDFNGIDGDYAEFGCWGAQTFRLAYAASRLTGANPRLWAFDSFEGLPVSADERDAHPVWQPGSLSVSEREFHELCALAGIQRTSYSTVVGFYNETLRDDALGPRPERISLAYIDCDLYSSTVSVLAFLEPRLRQGMVLAFDDYFCFGPEAASGERLAATEFFNSHGKWRLVPYIQFGWHGMSFMVEDRSLVPER